MLNTTFKQELVMGEPGDSEQEVAHYQEAFIYHRQNTLLQTPDQNNSEQDWQGSNPATPGTSRQMLLSEIGPGGLLRADTLEINPGFINPHDIATNSHQPNDVTWVSYAANEQVVKQEDSPPFNEIVTEGSIFIAQSLQQQHQQPGVSGYELYPFQPQNVQLNLTSMAVPSPTSANPSSDCWPGQLNFKVSFSRLAVNTKNKSWDFSQKLNKLFIDFNKHVLACCTVGSSPPDGLFVRVLPVYAVANSLQEPVRRCPNHADSKDISNQGFPEEHRWHLIRVNHDSCSYQEDPASKRLSVVVPLEHPQGGTEYSSFSLKFMCLGSDVGGINRKPVKVIFTLETGPGTVIGRYSVDVRICSCPKRDKQQEELRRQEDEDKVREVAVNLARANSNLSQSQQMQSKKRKVEKDVEEMVLMPVSKLDYEKMNEFAEAAMIVRNPTCVSDIRAQRKRLFDKANGGLTMKPVKK